MNPTDTQIDRMSDLFAQRLRSATTPAPAARRAWKSALTYARATGTLQSIEERMTRERADDPQLQAAWSGCR